jgi:CRISPR-associated protein Cas6
MLDVRFLYKPFIYLDKYSLYAALCRRIPNYKDDITIKFAYRKYDNQHGELIFRCPKDKSTEIISLMRNGTLEINRQIINIGEARICPIIPRGILQSAQVIIKSSKGSPFGRRDVEFIESLQKQLEELQISRFPRIGEKKMFGIKGQLLHGYPVRFEDLKEDESIRLQYFGVGGKQKMGCGVMLEC